MNGAVLDLDVEDTDGIVAVGHAGGGDAVGDKNYAVLSLAAVEHADGLRVDVNAVGNQLGRDARVVDPDEPARSASRLALARATQVTLARTLELLGISAPESM